MKKPFTLVKNVKFCSTTLGLLFLSTISNAQVVYKDLDPDVTTTITTDDIIDYNIDMNADGTEDFRVRISQLTNTPMLESTISDNSVHVDALAEGCLIAVTNITEQLAIAFNTDETINSSHAWNDESTLFSKGSITPTGGAAVPHDVGNFKNSKDAFVGVILMVDGIAHYGYIGINTTLTSFTVRDYAFEQKANTAIVAGAVNTGISPYIKSNSSIKNINNIIVAEFVDPFDGKMEIVNMNGQLIKSKSINGTKASVSMEETPSGIYQVVVSGAEGFATERVLVISQ